MIKHECIKHETWMWSEEATVPTDEWCEGCIIDSVPADVDKFAEYALDDIFNDVLEGHVPSTVQSIAEIPNAHDDYLIDLPTEDEDFLEAVIARIDERLREGAVAHAVIPDA